MTTQTGPPGIGMAGHEANGFAHVLGSRYHAYTNYLNSENYEDPSTHEIRTYQDGDLTGPYFPESGYKGTRFVSPQMALKSTNTIVYVNGINNDLIAHMKAAQTTANKENHPVVGVFNATGITKVKKLTSALLGETWGGLIGSGLGFAVDLAQCLSDDEGNVLNNPAITTLVGVLEQSSSRNIVAHSQGTLIVTAAFRQLKDKDKRKQRDLSGYNVKFFGSPASTRIIGPHYAVDTSNNDDAVASIAMDTLSAVRNIRRSPKLLLAQIGIHTSAFGDNEISRYNNRILTPDSGIGIAPHEYGDYENRSLAFDAPGPIYGQHGAGIEATMWPATFKAATRYAVTRYNAWGPETVRKAKKLSRAILSKTLRTRKWLVSQAYASSKWGVAKTQAAFSWSRNKAYASGIWLGDKAHDAGQWALHHRAQIGDKLHLVSSILGGASAGLGIVAGGLALTGVGLPVAAVLGALSLTLAAASAAAEAWYAVTKSVGTIDGSVTTGEANHAAAQAAKNLALTFVSVELASARAVTKAKTMLETKNALSFLHSDPRTVLQLDKATKFLNRLPGVNLGMVFRNASLAQRLKTGDLAIKVAQLPAKLASMGGIAGVLQTWYWVENKALGFAHKGIAMALTAVHAGRQAFQKMGRGGLHLLQNAGRDLTSVGHGVIGHLTHLRSQAMQLAAKAQQWARQGVQQDEEALLTGLASALRHSHTLAATAGSLFGRSRGRILGGVTSAFTAALSQNLSAARSMFGFLEGGGHPKQIGSALHEVTRNLSGITHSIADTLGSAWGMDLHLAGPPDLPVRLAMPTFGRSPFSPMGGLPALAFSAPQAHGAGAQHLMGAWNPFSPQRSGGQQGGGGLMALAASVVSGAARDHLPHALPSFLPVAAHSLGASALFMPGQVSGLLHHLTTPARHLLPHAMPERGASPRQSAGLVRSTAHVAHTLLSPVQRALHQGALHTAGLRRSLPATPVLPTIRHLLPAHLAAVLPGIAAHPLLSLRTAKHRVQQGGHQALSRLPKVPTALANIGHGLGHFFQRKGTGDHPDVNPAALRADLRKQSSGFLLDSNIRAKLGGHLGFDPGGARLHTGPAAASAARRLNAEAFTIGNDVFFGEGRFDPHTPKGLGLIAHELTHVGQQTGTTGSKARFFSEAGGDQMEREAQHTAEHVLANAGSRSGLFVEDYVREYEGEDGLTQADQQRLDRISVMALAEAQRMLAREGMHGSVNADALDVQVEIDLAEMSDSEAARVWAETILSSMNAVAPAGAQAFELNHQEQAQTGGIQRSKSHSGIPSSGAAKLSVSPPAAVPTPAVQMHDFVFNGKSQLVTEEEYQHLVAEANRRLMIRLGLVESGADFGRKMQDDFMQDTHHGFAGIFGKTSDWMGGVKPPAPAIWEWPKPPIVSGRKALQSQNLTEAAAQFTIANSKLAQAQGRWHDYIDGTISGGETGIKVATVVRDTSFSIAVGSAAIVAAPIAIGLAGSAAAGVGLTGTAAAIGTGVGATGIVTVGGGIMGAGLRGSSEIGGEALANHGRVNWQEVGSNTWDGAKHGAVDAATSLIGMGMGRVGAKFIRPGLESLGARTIRGIATGAASGGVGGFLNAVVTPPKRRKEDGPESWSGWAKRVGMSTALGVGGGALGSAGNELLAGAAPGTMRRILAAGTSNAISGGGTAAAQEAMDARREHRQFDRNAIYKGAASAGLSSGLQAGAGGAYRTRTPNGTRSMVSLEAHNNRFDQAFRGGSAAHRAMEPHPVSLPASNERLELDRGPYVERPALEPHPVELPQSGERVELEQSHKEHVSPEVEEKAITKKEEPEKYGRVAHPGDREYSFNSVENPGPLADFKDTPAANFRSGQYDTITLEHDTVFYRLGGKGGGRNALGQWFTREPTVSAAQGTDMFAIKAQWIDPKTGVLTGQSPLDASYKILIPKGTMIYEGPTGSQGAGFSGGGIQQFIPEPWNMRGVKVLGEQPLP